MALAYGLRKALKAIQVAILAISVWAVVISGLVYFSELEELHRSPRAPVAEAGRVIPLEWGEISVYITAQEAGKADNLLQIFAAALGFFFMNLILFGWQHGLPMKGDRKFWKDFWNK
jgi:hypothetical protein